MNGKLLGISILGFIMVADMVIKDKPFSVTNLIFLILWLLMAIGGMGLAFK